MARAIELNLLDVGDGLLRLGVVEGNGNGTTAPATCDRVGLDETDAMTVGGDGTVAGVDLDTDFFGGTIIVFGGAFVVVGEGGNADFLEARTAVDVLCAAALNTKPDASPWDCDEELVLAVGDLEGESAVEVKGQGADQVTALFL